MSNVSSLTLRAVLALLPFIGCAASTNAPRAAPPRSLAERAALGAYAPGVPYYEDALRELEGESQLGMPLEIVSGFVDWDYVFGGERDLRLSQGGARPLLYSWEPHCQRGLPEEEGCIRFRDVAAGRQDAYFARIADSMRRFQGTIYVRPWAEMNAHWSAWQPGSGRPRAGSVEEFKQAWRHTYDFFRVRGVTNLRFVFNPDAAEDASSVPVASLWPGRATDGRAYVDVLGIDGYNWGESGLPRGNSWRELEAVFGPMYEKLTALDREAPVWLCEVGSKEPQKDDGTARSPAPIDPAHDKGAWLERALASTALPRVEALVFFSAVPGHSDYRRDFRLDSSTSSLAAVRRYARLRARRKAP